MTACRPGDRTLCGGNPAVAGGALIETTAPLADRSEESVKAHVRRILSKLGANSRTQAVTIARKRGIIGM